MNKCLNEDWENTNSWNEIMKSIQDMKTEFNKEIQENPSWNKYELKNFRGKPYRVTDVEERISGLEDEGGKMASSVKM